MAELETDSLAGYKSEVWSSFLNRSCLKDVVYSMGSTSGSEPGKGFVESRHTRRDTGEEGN